jgi:hypothetical protein
MVGVNEADRCVLLPRWGQWVISCLYVDDLLIFETSLDVINEVKTFSCQSFDMKDMGETNVILNIKLIKGENEITLTQSHYVEKVLSHFSYKNSKPSSTPYDPSLVLQKNKRIGRDQLRYSQIIESLMYLARCYSDGPLLRSANKASKSRNLITIQHLGQIIVQ